MPPLVSVVLSFRNEAETIPAMVARLEAVFAGQDVDYELLYVNDASTDSSAAVLLREHHRNPRVKVITLSRRFGVAEGVRAGLAAASGDAAIFMDADLQDPPELIPEMLKSWRNGADVVHTVRTRRRGENATKMWLTKVAYRIIQAGSSIELPVDAGDFKLLSRAAVNHLLALRESDPYLRGLAVWVGMNQALIPYEREARHAGRTHFPFFSRNPWKTFALGLTSFSFMPVYACVVLTAAGLLASISLAALALAFLAAGSPLTRQTALVGLLTFFWATTMGAISVVGIYMIRIYKDVRARPQYIVESTMGLPATAPADLTSTTERIGR